MSRSLFRLISIAFWCVFALVVAASWRQIEGAYAENYPQNATIFAGITVAVVAAVVFFVNTWLADMIAPLQTTVKKVDPAAARAQKIKDAEAAIAAGREKLAIQIYEEVGLMMRALEVAQKIDDKAALARISFKTGKFTRAAKFYIETADFEAAANMSLLSGEADKARELYLMAASAAEKDDKKKVPLDRIARLYDRARQRSRAAELYELSGDPRRAAECYELSGNFEKSKVLAEQAKMLELYERKQAGGHVDPTGKRRASLQNGELLEGLGDLMGAGEAFRDAEEFLRAAACYERAEEWERAARCFDALNMSDRAAAVRSREQMMSASRVDVPMLSSPAPRTPQPPPTSPPVSQLGGAPQASPATPARPKPPSTVHPLTNAPQARTPATHSPLTQPLVNSPPVPLAPPAIPLPAAIPPPTFVPATQQVQYVPIYVPAGPFRGQQNTNAPAQLATFIQQKQYGKAAELAFTARNYSQAAQLYTQGGEFVQAADVFRQIGQIDKAAELLGQAKQPFEAAMLSMAVGKWDRAEAILKQEVKARKDPEMVCLLGEMMIERGQVEEAVAMLEEKFGGEAIVRGTDAIFYRFGRLLEKNGALPQALSLYERIMDSGAESEDLTSRVKKIREKLGIAPPPEQIQPEGGARTPGDFLKRFLDESSSTPEPPAPKPTGGKKPKPYPFSPPNIISRYETLPVPRPDGDTSAIEPLRQISLFGSPAAAPLTSHSINSEGVTEARPAGAIPAAARNPFAPIARYEIRRELGRGGMGAVYEAMDTILTRRVALKLIGNQDASPSDLEQFLLEARAIARLAHQNVVMVYDVGLIDLRHYIAMEYIEGNDLRKEVMTAKRLPLKDALRYAVEIARGLQAAHEAGIIHRDIKPANILLTAKKQVKLVDFGLAKLAREKAGDDEGKSVFHMAGTPGYMAPEQITGAPITPAADVYSFGITLYTMLAGEPPHRVAGVKLQHEIFDLQLKGRFHPLKDIRNDIPAPIEQIIQHCTAVDQKGRYQSFDAFLGALEQWQQMM